MRINAKYALAVLSASVGSAFQHGYNEGIINVAHRPIEDWIQESKSKGNKGNVADGEILLLWSIVVSIFPFGAMVGSAMTALCAKTFGRKGGLMWNNTIIFLAAVFIFFAKYINQVEMFIFGRFLIGINAGLNSGLCPIYLTEIAPISLRGSTVAVYFFILSISMSVSHLVSLKQILGNQDLWPYVFIMNAIPATIQIIMLRLCPESPNFLLISLQDDDEARRALEWFRNTRSISYEMDRLREYRTFLMRLPNATMKTMFTDSIYRNPFIISVSLMICQQCCGIDLAIDFSATLLERSGLSPEVAHLTTICMGIVLVVTSFFCMILMETVGRRQLFLLSLCGVTIDLIFLIVVFSLPIDDYSLRDLIYGMVATGTVLLGGWFGLGTGIVPFVVTFELFHDLARPLAVSLILPINWCAYFVLEFFFLHLQEKWGRYVLVMFIILDILFFLFIQMYLPETKQKTSEDFIRLFYDLHIDHNMQGTASAF